MNILKQTLKIKTFFVVLLLSASAMALTEKNEVYLFSCQISSVPSFEQIVLKSVQVEEPSGVFEYFALDIEAGNQVGDATGVGEHLKYVKTLLTSQNADEDTFYRNYGDSFQLDAFFTGDYRSSKVQINLDKLPSGKYELDLNGSGDVFYDLESEYNEALSQSEFYRRGDLIECFVHPRVDDFLD